jgi:hypothetical protein
MLSHAVVTEADRESLTKNARSEGNWRGYIGT